MNSKLSVRSNNSKQAIYSMIINWFLIIVVYYLASSIYTNSLIYTMKFLLVINIVIIAVLDYLIENDSKKTNRSIISTLFYIFFITIFITLILTNVNTSKLFDLSGLLILYLISIVIMPIYIYNTDKWLFALSFFNIILFSVLIISFFDGYIKDIITYADFGGGRIRYKSILVNANSLGLYAKLSIMSSISLLYINRKKKYLLTLVPTAIFLYFSNSRASILSILTFIFTLILITLYLSNNKVIIKITNYILSFILIILLYNSKNITMYFMNLDFNELVSGRIDRWIIALSSVDNIWIGGAPPDMTNPHNFFLNLTANYGLISAMIFLIIVAYLIIILFLEIKNNDKNRYIIVSFSLMIAFLVYSMFEKVFFNIGNLGSLFLWVNIGLALQDINQNDKFENVYFK